MAPQEVSFFCGKQIEKPFGTQSLSFPGKKSASFWTRKRQAPKHLTTAEIFGKKLLIPKRLESPIDLRSPHMRSRKSSRYKLQPLQGFWRVGKRSFFLKGFLCFFFFFFFKFFKSLGFYRKTLFFLRAVFWWFFVFFLLIVFFLVSFRRLFDCEGLSKNKAKDSLGNGSKEWICKALRNPLDTLLVLGFAKKENFFQPFWNRFAKKGAVSTCLKQKLSNRKTLRSFKRSSFGRTQGPSRTLSSHRVVRGGSLPQQRSKQKAQDQENQRKPWNRL